MSEGRNTRVRRQTELRGPDGPREPLCLDCSSSRSDEAGKTPVWTSTGWYILCRWYHVYPRRLRREGIEHVSGNRFAPSPALQAFQGELSALPPCRVGSRLPARFPPSRECHLRCHHNHITTGILSAAIKRLEVEHSPDTLGLSKKVLSSALPAIVPAQKPQGPMRC